MGTFGLQRRLDALARDVGEIHRNLEGVLRRLGAPLDPRDSACGEADEVDAARALIGARRARERLFGDGLFADPAWDMLLALFVADAEGEPLSVSQLCGASGVPHTTALRWIESLARAGLIVRAPDARDARRTLISLHSDAREKVRQVLARGQPAAA
jgi:DNA-binding transcriptional ArsR family regulator